MCCLHLSFHRLSGWPSLNSLYYSSITLFSFHREGLLVVGPDKGVFIFNILLTLLLSVVYFIFIAYRIHIVVLLLSIPLYIMTTYSLLLTAFTDPGIIPRNTPSSIPISSSEDNNNYDNNDNSDDLRWEIGGLSMFEFVRKHIISKTPQWNYSLAQRVKQKISNPPMAIITSASSTASLSPSSSSSSPPSPSPTPLSIPLKYCSTCNIWRPPRSHHDRDIDCDVQNYDHMCPWTSTVIGFRNYKYFVSFIWSLTIYTLWVSLWSFYLIIITTVNSDSLASALTIQPAAVAVAIFTAVMSLCFVSLSCYHCFLVGNHMSTKEHIKKGKRQNAQEMAMGNYIDQMNSHHSQGNGFFSSLHSLLYSEMAPSFLSHPALIDKEKWTWTWRPEVFRKEGEGEEKKGEEIHIDINDREEDKRHRGENENDHDDVPPTKFDVFISGYDNENENDNHNDKNKKSHRVPADHDGDSPVSHSHSNSSSSSPTRALLKKEKGKAKGKRNGKGDGDDDDDNDDNNDDNDDNERESFSFDHRTIDSSRPILHVKAASTSAIPSA